MMAYSPMDLKTKSISSHMVYLPMDIKTVEQSNLFFYSQYKKKQHEETQHLDENEVWEDNGEYSLWNYWNSKKEEIAAKKRADNKV